MDIFSHALAGAATGALWGRPVLGAVVAAAPDLVLGWRRRRLPSVVYNVTHSLPFVTVALAVTSLVWGLETGTLVMMCLLSHLFLDIPTHGRVWGPPLMYPFDNSRAGFGEEWEFFNDVWWRGLVFTFAWSFACLEVWFVYRIGCQLLRCVP